MFHAVKQLLSMELMSLLTLTPSQDELAAASYYFLGGHEYEISDYQAQVLIDAGYGDYVTPV
jgi:hypothetical protein